MKASVASYFGIYPENLYQENDELWQFLIANPQVGPKEGSCLRGAEYYPEADCLDRMRDGEPRATATNVHLSWGALYDVDDFQKRGVTTPPTIDEVVQSWAPYRCIAWTSYSHLSNGPADCRYKVFIPFAVGVKAEHHKFFHEQIRLGAGSLGVEGQSNVDRLTYLPRLRDANAPYEFRVAGDERIDPYKLFGEPPEDWVASAQGRRVVGAPVEPDRANWITDEEAFEKARAYFYNLGPEVTAGSRHEHLLKWGCVLWWDFWLEEEAVEAVLLELNNRFPEPKRHSEVRAEVLASYERTRGESAREQGHFVSGKWELKEPGCKRLRPEPPNFDDLMDRINKMSRSKQSSRVSRSKEIRKVVRQKADGSYEKPADGDVETHFLTAARALGQEFPEAHPQELFAHIQGAHTAQGGDAAVATQSILQAIMQGSAEERAAAAKRMAAVEADRTSKIKRAFAYVGIHRLTPYTPMELERWAGERGLTVEELMGQLILNQGNRYSFFINGGYSGWIDRTGAAQQASVLLSPVDGFHATLGEDLDLGDLKPISLLMQEYGTIAEQTLLDLTVRRSYFLPEGCTFVDASVSWNDAIHPEYSPYADAFLQTFDGYQDLVKWLSWCTDLTKPLPMLYIEGEAGTGKSLLAKALSKIWTKNRQGTVVRMQELVSKHASGWTRCPLTVAEEALPRELLRNSARFRELITSSTMAVEKKFMDAAEVTGYLRFMVLANNREAIPGIRDDEATTADARAITERLVYVQTTQKSSETLHDPRFSGPESLITDNILANHVAWLTLNAKEPLVKGHRFPAVFSSPEALISSSVSPFRERFLMWLAGTLTVEATKVSVQPTGEEPPNVLANPPPMPTTVQSIRPALRDGRAYIALNPTGARSSWQNVEDVSDDKVPSTRRLKTAVQFFCPHGRSYKDAGTGRKWWYLSPRIIIGAAEAAGMDEDVIEQQIRTICHRELAQGYTLA